MLLYQYLPLYSELCQNFIVYFWIFKWGAEGGGGGWVEDTSQVAYGWGPGSHLRALEALGFQMLSHAIWALFWSILYTKLDTKNMIDHFFFGGGGGVMRPTWIRHWTF